MARGLDTPRLVFTQAATIGGITPPVGSLLFVACRIGRIGLTEASRAIWPFVVALVLVNALLILFPSSGSWPSPAPGGV